jgi:thiol-disulfide isomerase/thioredoxin
MRDVDPALARQELLGVQIDAASWSRFLGGDRAISTVLQGDAALLQRFRALDVSTVRAFERFLQSDRSLAGALKTAGVSPREYAGTHLAMALAIQEGRGAPAAMAALPPAVRANIAFVGSHQRDVKSLAVPLVALSLRVVASPPAAPAVPPKPDAAPVSLVPAHSPSAPAAAAESAGPIDVSPGAEIPDFRFVDLNGNTRSLSDFRGKYLLLDFWGSWCPPCRAEIPFAKAAYGRFRARGFEILGMDYEKSAAADQVRAYLQQNGVTWTFAAPESVRGLIVDRFQVNSFPTMFLLDPQGRVMPIRESALRGQALAATLDRILPR